MMFLTGTVVDDAGAQEPTKDEQKKEKETARRGQEGRRRPPPPPKFSARAKLVEVALQPGEREFFARSIVNRMWHRFFGLGLVMPLDQMHSREPAEPSGTARLAGPRHGRARLRPARLIRGIVLSQAYARGSRYERRARPTPRCSPSPRLRAADADATGDVAEDRDDRPGEPFPTT